MSWFASDEDKQARQQTRLNRMLFKNNIEKIRTALSAGADPNVLRDDEGRSALFLHASQDRADIVALLLEHHARPDFGMENGNTPLMITARNGHENIVRLLCEKGADLNLQCNGNGWSALHNAAYWGRGNILRYMVERGADLDLLDHRMNSAADIAEKEKYPGVVAFLRGDKAKPAALPAPEDTGWHLTAKDEVTQVSEKPAIHYRLTEVFNFSKGLYTHIATNTVSGAESQSMLPMRELPSMQMIRTAMEELTRLGGELPESATTILDKPTMPLRGMGGTP